MTIKCLTLDVNIGALLQKVLSKVGTIHEGTGDQRITVLHKAHVEIGFTFRQHLYDGPPFWIDDTQSTVGWRASEPEYAAGQRCSPSGVCRVHICPGV